MFSRFAICCLAGMLALSGCKTPYKEKDQQQKDEESGRKIKDQSTDTSFQAVLGRLRNAANRKDRVTMSTMMVLPYFGWRWDPEPAGETPFDYWDQKNLWPVLQKTLREPFVPFEDHMVAVSTDPEFPGYRAGMKMVKGTWKLAYFVGPEEPGQ
jgi:hypothetical protein